MNYLRLLTRASMLTGIIACSACALPKSAPVAISVEEAPSQLEADYFVVPLLPSIVQVMGNRREEGFPAAFHLGNYRPSIALNPGDIISVTIFEVGASPTFGGVLPNQQIGDASEVKKTVTAALVESPSAIDQTRSRPADISPMPGKATLHLTGLRAEAVKAASAGLDE